MRDAEAVDGAVRRAAFVKVCRARGKDGEGERWADDAVAPTVNLFDVTPTRFVTLIVDCIGTRRETAAQSERNTTGTGG